MSLVDIGYGIKVTNQTPTGDAGIVLKDNFEILKDQIQYVHEQGVASTVWVISHNLGRPVVIQAYEDLGSSGKRLMDCEVTQLSNNTAEARFNSSISGFAYCA